MPNPPKYQGRACAAAWYATDTEEVPRIHKRRENIETIQRLRESRDWHKAKELCVSGVMRLPRGGWCEGTR